MIVLEHGILTQEELDTILLPENMIKPVKLDIKSLSGARTGARLIWCTSRSSIPTLGMCGTNVIASSTDSGLEAFSHYPADGSFAPLPGRTGANTNYLNQRFLSY